MHIFFTVKNTLVLVLMIYRLFVLFESKRSQYLAERRQLSDDVYINMDKVRGEKNPGVVHWRRVAQSFIVA